MGMTDDQRAMLRLLARREEGYEDIAALMGLSIEEVRAKVKEALAALDEQPAAAPPPSAEVEPPPRERPAPPPERQPEPQSPAEPPRPAAPSPPPPSKRPPGISRLGMPRAKRRLAELGGGVLIVLLVVLFATGAVDLDGGSDSGSAAGNGADGGNGAQDVAAGNGELTQANLRPVGGGEGRGRAIFGRVGEEEVVLQVTAQDIEPTTGDQSYTVWLHRSPELSLRVGSAKVDNDGRLGTRFPIPAELLAYVASGAFPRIQISRTSDAAYEREVARAEKQESLPRYSGQTVLRGRITGPIVESGNQ